MLDATDKEVGAILESVRNAAPGVIEQAVAYYWVTYSVWLGVFLAVTVVSLFLCKRWFRRWGESDSYEICAVVAAIVGACAALISIALAVELGRMYFAPDYYAAECMAELGRKALGK